MEETKKTFLPQLKEISTLFEFADLINQYNQQNKINAEIYTAPKLAYIIYGNYKNLHNNPSYTTFTIPKKTGGQRIIHSPNYELKNLQQIISKLLQDIYINELYVRNSVSFAFLKNKTIFDNAKKHKRKRYVFNIDLKDFFPSITYSRVYGYFLKNKHFKLNELIARLLANLTTYNKLLPIGASTSPIISNLIANKLDKAIIHFLYQAYQGRVHYSRYADDMTFSTNLKDFPQEIAILNIENNNWNIGNKLQEIINKNGFTVNRKKTRMSYKDSQQTVTGLVVNEKVNVNRRYIRKIRSQIHKIMLAKKVENHTIKKLLGSINFIADLIHSTPENIKLIEEDKPPIYPEYLKNFATNIFLIQNCLFNSYPTILCEGKTDVIYLKSALKALYESDSEKYKKFIEKEETEDEKGNKKITYKYKLNFINKPKKDIHDLKLLNGDNNLETFYNQYFNNKDKKSKHKLLNYIVDKKKSYYMIPKEPVICIFDNDQDDNFKGKYYKPNLYSILLPKPNEKSQFINNNDDKSIVEKFCIEYYFKEDLLDTRIPCNDKKTRKLNYQIGKPGEHKKRIKNKTTFYIDEKNNNTLPKIIFATYVAKNWHTIDFSNFESLFDEIAYTINKYKKK